MTMLFILNSDCQILTDRGASQHDCQCFCLLYVTIRSTWYFPLWEAYTSSWLPWPACLVIKWISSEPTSALISSSGNWYPKSLCLCLESTWLPGVWLSEVLYRLHSHEWSSSGRCPTLIESASLHTTSELSCITHRHDLGRMKRKTSILPHQRIDSQTLSSFSSCTCAGLGGAKASTWTRFSRMEESCEPSSAMGKRRSS